jgi:hypothetical protein
MPNNLLPFSPAFLLIRIISVDHEDSHETVHYQCTHDSGCLIPSIPTLITRRVLFFSFHLLGGRGCSRVKWEGITRHDGILDYDVAGFAFAALLIIQIFHSGKFFRHIGKRLKTEAKEPDDCMT